jgi:hypothetical protein
MHLPAGSGEPDHGQRDRDVPDIGREGDAAGTAAIKCRYIKRTVRPLHRASLDSKHIGPDDGEGRGQTLNAQPPRSVSPFGAARNVF